MSDIYCTNSLIFLDRKKMGECSFDPLSHYIERATPYLKFSKPLKKR